MSMQEQQKTIVKVSSKESTPEVEHAYLRKSLRGFRILNPADRLRWSGKLEVTIAVYLQIETVI